MRGTARNDSQSWWSAVWERFWNHLWHDDGPGANENRTKLVRAILTGYFLVLIAGVPELWFHYWGHVVPAHVERVYPDSRERWHVDWSLTNPESGNIVRDSAILKRDQLPHGETIDVQFVDGIVPMSRPVARAELRKGWIFLAVQFSPLAVLGLMAIYAAWECHTPMLTRQQRLMRDYQRRKAREAIPQLRRR